MFGGFFVGFFQTQIKQQKDLSPCNPLNEIINIGHSHVMPIVRDWPNVYRQQKIKLEELGSCPTVKPFFVSDHVPAALSLSLYSV